LIIGFARKQRQKKINKTKLERTKPKRLGY